MATWFFKYLLVERLFFQRSFLTVGSAGPDRRLRATRFSFVQGISLYFISEQSILDNDWRKGAWSADFIWKENVFKMSTYKMANYEDHPLVLLFLIIAIITIIAIIVIFITITIIIIIIIINSYDNLPQSYIFPSPYPSISIPDIHCSLYYTPHRLQSHTHPWGSTSGGSPVSGSPWSSLRSYWWMHHWINTAWDCSRPVYIYRQRHCSLECQSSCLPGEHPSSLLQIGTGLNPTVRVR